MPAAATAETEGRLRVVTLNLWGEQEPLQARMAACVRALAALRPDVIALQEVREIPGVLENQAAQLARALGYRFAFAPATEWGGGWEGLAVLSRHPIVSEEHGELPHAHSGERRILLLARVAFPGQAEPVLVGVTHLNYRLTDGLKREDQVEALERRFAAALPSAALGLLCGDFNATPDSDEIRFLRGLHTLAGRRVYYQDAYARVHPDRPGYSWSRLNPFTHRLRWLDGDRRIDYVFVSPMRRDGRGYIHDARLVLDVPDGSGVYPADHFGVYAEVQALPGELS